MILQEQLIHWDKTRHKCYTKCKIKLRTNLGREIKESCLALNDLELFLRVEWKMDEDDPYPGEFALSDSKVVNSAATESQLFSIADIAWIASGDVEIIEPIITQAFYGPYSR